MIGPTSSSALNRFCALPVCIAMFACCAFSIESADAAIPQLKFDKRAPVSNSQLSIPKKKIGVGYPSPYSSSNSSFNSLNRSRGPSHYGNSYSTRNSLGRSGTSYSYGSRSNRGGTSIILSVPSRYNGLARTHSTYYRPTYGFGNYGPSSYGYGAPTYPTYPTYYSTYRQYQPYAIPNGGVPKNYSNVYPTPSLRPTLSPSSSVLESQSRSRLLEERAYKPKTVSNQHYALITTSASARSYQSRAEQAFKKAQYADAASLARQALSNDPNNTKLQLFVSHANFANGDFFQAAAYLDQATRSATSDQWGFVVRNYQRFYGKNDYVPQTDRLSQRIATAPSASALAVRGYHYGSLGYAQAATSDFQQALSYDPDNALVKRLLPVLGVVPEPLSPEDIQAPVPGGTLGNGDSVFEPRTPQADDGIIRLVPQYTDAEMVDSVPVDSGQSILLNGPAD